MSSRKTAKKTVSKTKTKAPRKTPHRSVRGWITGIALLLCALGAGFSYLPEERIPETLEPVHTFTLRTRNTVKFGPLTVTAPDDLEGFLRYNYPTLHRFTKEEQEKVNNHYPAALSFSTTPKQEL